MTLQADGRKLVSVGNYRLTGKRLGKGNFARVEEAVHSVLNTKVALKIMDISAIKEDYVIRNLYREAKIMSKLFHPCIAALFQTMQFGNLYYLVMELVGGGDLCSFIKAQRNGKLDERCTRVYARQLVSAISHMHNVGIVHRDLKMENLMLNSIHTQIKIVDFGLSNTYTDSNPLRTHCGSPEYAAPELFMEGKHYGPEVDLWSLGVILYGMVIGQLPFVTNRESNMTSQERRKKLLEQINKGIAAPHRRAMTLFSIEFKGMIGRLLMPDAPKRITIKELIFHPWITEKGRKAVRSNPLKKLDEQHQTIIIKDMSSLLHLNVSEVDFAIKSEPQGNIAGTYNILAFKQTLHQIEGDGVTRIIPDQPLNYTTPRSRGSTLKAEKTADQKSLIKRKEGLKSAPLQKTTSRMTPRTPTERQHLSAQKSVMYKKSANTPTGETDSVKKKIVPKILLSKWEKSSGNKGNPVSDFVPLKKTSLSSDEHKRRVKSSEQQIIIVRRNKSTHPIENVLNFTRSNSPKSSTPRSRTPRPQSTVATPTIKDRKIVMNQVEGQTTAGLKGNKGVEKLTPKQLAMRIQSANSPNLKPLQTSSPSRRPLTGPTHTAERALKRRSMLPVTTNNCTPSRGALSAATPQSAPARNHKIVQLQKLSEMNEFKAGDAAKKRLTPRSPTPKTPPNPFVNEPIARSIAGYVVNNIPSKLQSFKWIRATKKEDT